MTFTAVSMSALLYDPTPNGGGPNTLGTPQDPPPSGYDWAFLFNVGWTTATNCTLVVRGTDADGYTMSSPPSTNLQFS
jgi:hypothetical protein